jgi:O-acetylserine/cysteine efflux transporter
VSGATSVLHTEPGSIEARDLTFLVAINFIWGLNLIASKIGVDQFPPVFFTGLRFTAIALLLLPFIKIFRGQMPFLLLAAILTGPGAFALLFVGVHLVEDASMIAIASQMSVPFSTLLSVWLLGETIRWRRCLGITLAFAGMALISFDPRVFAYWQGLLLVIVSCFVSSLGLMFVKRLHDIRALQLQAWVALAGGPSLVFLSFLTETDQWVAVRSANWEGWCALFFATVMSSLIAHTGWYYLVSRYPVTSLSPITLLSPLFGVCFGVALLNDQLTWRMLLGGGITLLGVFIVLMREKRLVDTGT